MIVRSGWGRRISRLACAVALSAAALSFARDRKSIDAGRLIEDIRQLASPEMAGRGPATEGLAKAAEYLAGGFKTAGVRPVPGSGYFQPFDITHAAVLGGTSAVAYERDGRSETLSKDDFLPFNFSGVGKASGGVVFAGYGITALEYGYDDYAGIDAAGKIAVILRHEPQEYGADSAFEGRIYTEHAQLLSKAINARKHGAAGIVFVSDTAAHSGPDTLEPFTALPAPGDARVPFVQVKAAVVEGWFAAAGKDFAAVQRDIDSDLSPRSFAFPANFRVHLTVDIERANRTVHNVAAYIPGETAEYVIAGAHYDHLGMGEQFSLAPDKVGVVHPGADDNASGAACLLALARWAAGQPPQRRGLLLLAFAGEEIGLLGSVHYVNNPLLPVENAVAMLNMDMVGRLRDKNLIVGGAASGEGLLEIVRRAAASQGLKVDTEEKAVYGSSDHTTFKARMLPVLFFFTGLHADYHRPTDTADRVSARDTAKVAGVVAHAIDELRRRPERPRFAARPPAKIKAQEKPAGGR